MRLLDAFCGGGGAAVGYHRAGFDEIVGIDHVRQKNYPFDFVQADALEYVRDHWHDFDAIHASPPCQAHSSLRHCTGKTYVDLVPKTRLLLTRTCLPWVIENVVGVPMPFSIFLCGTMFPGLRVYRHRLFESNFWMWQPEHPKHKAKADAKKTHDGKCRKAHYDAGGFATVCGDVGSYCGEAMGIDWMTGKELSQAIPPAYTEWVGKRLIEAIDFRRMAS